MSLPRTSRDHGHKDTEGTFLFIPSFFMATFDRVELI